MPLGCGGTGEYRHGCAANKSCDAVTSTLTKISDGCFQHIVESMPFYGVQFYVM